MQWRPRISADGGNRRTGQTCGTLTSLSRLTFVLSLLCASGCPMVGPIAPSTPSWKEFRRLSPPEEAELLAQLTDQASRFQSLRLLLKSTLTKGLGREAFRQVIVFERPDKLRVEFFATGLNKLMAMVAVRDSQLEAFDAQASRAYRGSATAENLERVVSVPFLPEELMLWLAGQVRTSREEVLFEGLRNPTNSARGAKLTLGDGRVVIVTFAPRDRSDERLRLLTLEITNSFDGAQLFYSELQYPEVARPELPAGLPQRIRFWIPARSVKGEFQYEQAELNPDLSESEDRLFHITAPASAEVIDLDRAPTGGESDKPR